MFEWTMARELGYEPKTTFWSDFSIADRFGEDAVKDTFNRAFEEWKNDHVYLTELVMVLNHKTWQHQNNDSMCRLYISLFEKADAYALDNLKDEELMYFLEVTD